MSVELPVRASAAGGALKTPVVIGTAGWSIPITERPGFPAEGSSLQRYAARLAGVEVNSSFHRPHRRSTWIRWADSVPDDFRFAVKMPREISHARRLRDAEEQVVQFLDEVAGLGGKLSILLLQLPPSLAYEEAVASRFLADLVRRTAARLVCEPRHPTWFDASADALLSALGVARVAADPARVAMAAMPGGWRGMTYLRLHGSPQIYRSAYGKERLRAYAEMASHERDCGRPVWCMFDNTAASAALGDALAMSALLAS